MQELFRYPNVIGFGEGYKHVHGKITKQPATIVLVTDKVPEIQLGPTDLIPRELDGKLTDVLPVGIVRALVDRTARHRPAPGGVSIGHHAITAGTLGVVVEDATDGSRLILSNNHVLANSNEASKGEAIYQPGPADGGQLSDTIAYLERFVPIDFGQGGCLTPFLKSQQANLVDAALAKPLSDADISDSILEIGLVNGILPAFLGQAVRKSGRTTGLTHSSIQVIDATVQVQYGAGKIATFEDQLIAGPMSQGGDSGSLVVDEEEDAAVGLLFAGSDQVMIFNKISNVMQLLGVTI